ncbi:MAG TPA: efflux RND transporter periplasmic adaptor subunit, partial [Myxococcota bacterium]
EIDSAPYAAALAQAEAVLARDNAQAETADAEAARYTQLIAQKLVSSSDADAKIVAAKALHATVASDKAAVDTARLNLAWTRVTSPISGRADKRQVDLGNLVQIGAAATTVVVIRQISPIQVQFALPQERLLDVQQRVAAAAAGAPAVTVTATIPEHSDVSETGALSFLGGAVDPQSGTISCKADFANKEQHLWPGAYVQVRVTLGTAADAVVVPSAAIQTSQQGPFAFVVNDDLTVAMRPVVAGPAQDGMSVIASGIKAGDKVVVDGQLALVPGAKVAIKPPVAAPKDGAR